MSNRVNAFTDNQYNLGADKYSGMSKSDVDQVLKDTYTGTSFICIICGRPANYRLIPKHDKVNTTQIQDKGYICEHCVNGGTDYSKDFGIRAI
jgi:DNA-directed RNA polymerase subunit RPC12/RpoP